MLVTPTLKGQCTSLWDLLSNVPSKLWVIVAQVGEQLVQYLKGWWFKSHSLLVRRRVLEQEAEP